MQITSQGKSYLVLRDNKLVERKVSWLFYVIRALGSILSICDSNVVYCAKKSMEALNGAYENIQQGDFLSCCGREYSHIQNIQECNIIHQISLKVLNQNREIRCLDWLNVHSQNKFEEHVLTLLFEKCGRKDLTPYVKSFVARHRNASYFQRLKEYVFWGLKNSKNTFRSNLQNRWITDLLQSKEKVTFVLALHFDPEIKKMSKEEILNTKHQLLSGASLGGHQQLINWLEIEKEINLHQKDQNGNTILHFAAFGGQQQLINWLVCRKGINQHEKDRRGRNILHYAALGGRLDLIKWLLTKGFRLQEKDLEGATILHCAAYGGHKRLFEWLLSRGFRLKEKNTNGATALHYAAWGGCQFLIRSLLSKGFGLKDKNSRGATVLHYAALGGHQKLIQWLKEKGLKLNAKDGSGCIILHHAALGGHQELVEWLEIQGLALNEMDRAGNTVLHYAAVGGQKKLIKWLVEVRQFDSNIKNSKGYTYLNILDSAQ